MSEQEYYNLIIEAEQEGKRLDKVLSDFFSTKSREKVQDLIKNNAVKLLSKDAFIADNNYKVKLGEEFLITLIKKEVLIDLKPLKIDIKVLYEDKDLLVINKPFGISSHPGAGNNENTLVNWLLYYLGKDNLSKINGLERLGIVHRLDKDTSGVMVIAKNDFVHSELSKQFSIHSIERSYRALVYGVLKTKEGTIDNIIGRSPLNRKKMAVLKDDTRGKRAITHYTMLEVFASNKFSLVDLALETGRTHQIRVHLSNLGNPLVGDMVYGNLKPRIIEKLNDDEAKEIIKNLKRQALHAYKLAFFHPTKKEVMSFTEEEDDELNKLYDLLRKE